VLRVPVTCLCGHKFHRYDSARGSDIFEGVCKMKGKASIFAVLVVFLVVVASSASGVVDTSEIDKVRDKGVLDSGDLQIIDKFVAEAVKDLVDTVDFTSIARVRTVILSRKSSETVSAAAQYAEQFSESAHKYISEAFERVEMLVSEDSKLKAKLNLLILIDGLENLRLADLAVKMLNDDSVVICYWAVHSLTNPGIIKQLNSPESTDSQLASEIAEQLKNAVEGVSAEALVLMAKFGAEVKIRAAEDLLVKMADTRISKYAGWTVDYELVDAVILKSLCSKMSSDTVGNVAIARRFGQLYSYAIQRYVKGRDFLDAASKQQLASVLVETEKSCIGELLVPQSVTKRAVEQDNYTELLQEHSRLLGDETTAGRLGLKLGFDYGQADDGSRRTAPLALPEPPKELIIDN